MKLVVPYLWISGLVPIIYYIDIWTMQVYLGIQYVPKMKTKIILYQPNCMNIH